jgi:hypothetical protein
VKAGRVRLPDVDTAADDRHDAAGLSYVRGTRGDPAVVWYSA